MSKKRYFFFYIYGTVSRDSEQFMRRHRFVTDVILQDVCCHLDRWADGSFDIFEVYKKKTKTYLNNELIFFLNGGIVDECVKKKKE